MAQKHTPGPWSSDGRVLRNSRGESIASGGNNRAVTGSELAASLQLAATAPDLLAALELIDSNAAESVEWIRRVARTAIAKAKGE